jgi:hypothetical protein
VVDEVGEVFSAVGESRAIVVSCPSTSDEASCVLSPPQEKIARSNRKIIK